MNAEGEARTEALGAATCSGDRDEEETAEKACVGIAAGEPGEKCSEAKLGKYFKRSTKLYNILLAVGRLYKLLSTRHFRE